MNFVTRKGSQTVVRQVPFLLLFAAGLFGLPPLAFSLFHILRGTDADGKFFCLFFGLFILWLFLEFVATREKIVVDRAGKVLTRSVYGVFRRRRRQSLDLPEMEGIRLEMKLSPNATRRIKRQHLYIYGNGKEFLLNSPEKVYLDHGQLGKAVGEAAGIPYQGRVDGP